MGLKVRSRTILKSVVCSCEGPSKRTKMARPCKNSSATPSIAAISALLAEREKYRNCCETSTFENQCILGLVIKAKELRKSFAEREEADTALRATPKRQEKRATTADKRLATLETKPVVLTLRIRAW